MDELRAFAVPRMLHKLQTMEHSVSMKERHPRPACGGVKFVVVTDAAILGSGDTPAPAWLDATIVGEEDASPGGQFAVMPPSITNSLPVTQAASSAAK
jgi:hypothetical protein